MTNRLLLLLTLGLLAAPVAGCPGEADDDDSSVGDDDDATGDDDDATGDDDDATGDDDDSAGVTVTGLTINVDASSVDTRGTINVTFEATWSDSNTSNPTEADGLTATFTTTAGSDEDSWAEPALTSKYIATIEIGASYEGVDATTVTVDFTGASVNTGDLIVHEVLVDGTSGDANGDGTTDGNQDAFIEFLNTTDVELDLEGCQVLERDFDPNLARHTFGAGDSVLPNQAIVVFGGGSADITPAGATVVIADNASDPGTQLYLHLDPNGDIVKFRNAAGDLVTELPYGTEGTNGEPDANLDESITRSPQVTGTTWDAHTTVAGTPDLFSPGTQADGTAF